MPVSEEYVEFLLEQLEPFGDGRVRSRRMFGGAGLFLNDLMFALIADDRLYFKADDENRPRFLAEDLGPFIFVSKAGKRGALGYYEAPESALDDAGELLDWARLGYDAAVRAAASKPKKKPNKKNPKKK